MPKPVELFAENESGAIGSFFKSGSPTIAEVLGKTDLDFLLVDRQHASPDFQTIENVVRAADLNDLPVIVRLPLGSVDVVPNLLDAGVSGLVVPQVSSPEQISDVVAMTRFTEERSFATSTRAGRFGNRDRAEYLDWSENNIPVVPMIETSVGLESAADIAAVDGVTALMAGPADMAISLEVDRESPEHCDAIETVKARANAADVGFGKYVAPGTDLEAAADECSFLVYSSDTGILTTHLQNVL